ncbi:MAG: SpoIID/LytB domain-containing protein, partial [Firmicutes bacterium]|nr:SpoIID/LytB domain-containing protein [Bacillota bacterium]
MIRQRRKRWGITAALLAAAVLLAGCAAAGGEGEKPLSPGPDAQAEQKPPLPEKLALNGEGVPLLQVYDADAGELREMDLESYLLGVVAGEMKNDWPLEALKAQAILARTFVLKFCAEKESVHRGADISTDIGEAQAYDATGVNERVEQAVRETRGMVLSYHGELPFAWFHAHSGGATERAVEGLHYDGEEPGYIKVTQGRESDRAPEEARQWSARFTSQEVAAAARKAGADGIDGVSAIQMGRQGESGRAVTVEINGRSVSAPELRLALGATKMRSTLLTELRLEDGQIVMAGKGYGHGVGMPQWGA